MAVLAYVTVVSSGLFLAQRTMKRGTQSECATSSTFLPTANTARVSCGNSQQFSGLRPEKKTIFTFEWQELETWIMYNNHHVGHNGSRFRYKGCRIAIHPTGPKNSARVSRSDQGAKAPSTQQTGARILSVMKLLLFNLKIHRGLNNTLSLSPKGTKTTQQKVTRQT